LEKRQIINYYLCYRMHEPIDLHKTISTNNSQNLLYLHLHTMKQLATIFFCISFCCSLAAQQPGIDQQNPARDYYQRGEQALLNKDYKRAQRFFAEAVELSPNFTAALRGLGTTYELQGDYAEALDNYLQVLELDFRFSRILYYEVAQLLYRLGNYREALDYFTQFENMQDLPADVFGPNGAREAETEKEYVKKLKNNILACRISADSLLFFNIQEVVNLGPAINTDQDEYFPFVSKGENLLFYTKRKNAQADENLYFSASKDDIWREGQAAGNNFNSSKNEGMTSFVRSGRKMYFTACNRENVLGTCDIWEAEVDGKKVVSTKPLKDYPNSESWDSQASISCDGQVLYFASNREGGFGGTDIWVSYLEESGFWSAPKNLGPNINTSADEEAPFITNDGKTLYFSSTGHIGMGEQDLFFAQMRPDGMFSTPRNLGPPVNSSYRELGFFLSADGQTGYFASNREGGYGGMDIYKFQLSEQLQSEPITFVEGHVKDSAFQLPVPTVVHIPGRAPIGTDEQGRFFVCIPANDTLQVGVEHFGFLEYSNQFAIPYWENRTFYTIDILLQSPAYQTFAEEKKDTLADVEPIEKPKPVTRQVHQIYYEVNESTLDFDQKYTLEEFLDKLDKNLIDKVEVVGFADYVGTSAYNLKLSEDRAKSVAVFMKNRGVVVDKIYMEGKGEIQDDKPREENRKVEVVIYMKDG